MAQVNDIIKTSIVTEYVGSQMVNDLYWQIDDLGNDPSLLVAAIGILDAYAASIAPACTNTWAATCIVLENLTQNEGKTVGFSTTPGASAVFGHGPDQVLRANQYAGQPDFFKVHRGAFNQSGVTVAHSTRGRWNDLTQFAALKTFLGSTSVITPDWTIQPFLNWELLPPPAPTYSQTPITDIQYSSVVFKLGSRKSSLCAAS